MKLTPIQYALLRKMILSRCVLKFDDYWYLWCKDKVTQKVDKRCVKRLIELGVLIQDESGSLPVCSVSAEYSDIKAIEKLSPVKGVYQDKVTAKALQEYAAEKGIKITVLRGLGGSRGTIVKAVKRETGKENLIEALLSDKTLEQWHKWIDDFK